MPSVDERLDTLEHTVRQQGDVLAIYQVISRYGPTVDSVSPSGIASIWEEDGVYDSGGYPPMRGTQAIREMLGAPTHQALIARGCAHVMALPHVTVNGDRAVAIGYSQLLVLTDDAWVSERVSANRWELVRGTAGWRVTNRVNRTLDSSEQSRALLALE